MGLIAEKYLNPVQIGRFNSKEIAIIALTVALAHLLLAWMFHEPWKANLKRPDLQIEFATTQSGTGSDKNVAPSSSSTKAIKPTEPTKKPTLPISKDGAAAQAKVEKNVSQSSSARESPIGANTSAQIAGVENAATTESDRGPKLLSNPKPPYPSEAFRERKEGKVIVNIQVLESGEVGEVQLFRSSGTPSLDESALKTIKQWRFSPGIKSGKIAAQWVRVPITFSLKNH